MKDHDRNDSHRGHDHGGGMSPYVKFALMLATSFAVMYAVMYLHTYTWSHVRLSEMRFYMTSLMILSMIPVMMGFMWAMYKDKRKNYAWLAFAAIGFAIVVYLERSQVFVEDESWMSSMIPHHSIAVLTSERAELDDVRVHKLAEEIIAAQRREISEMEWLLNDIKENGQATTEAEAAARPVPEFSNSLYSGGPPKD